MHNSSGLSFEEIAATPIGRMLDAAGGDLVAARLARRSLRGGEVLYRQGQAGDALYLVLRGRLVASIAGDEGAVQRLGEIGPGEMVGAAALLSRAPHSETVEATETTEVAVLDAAAWHDLRTSAPALEPAAVRAIEWQERTSESRRYRPDAGWICAWLARNELLAGMGRDALAELERALIWEVLPGGELLVREGDAGDCMWFVVSGRLRALVGGAGATARGVGEILAGECVGEMALLSSAPRSTTVKAVRDTELLRLSRSAFDRVVAAYPEMIAGFTRTVVARLQRVLGARAPRLTERTLALVAAAPDVPLATFARDFAAALSRLAATVVLDGTAESRDAAARAGTDPEVVVLTCDLGPTPWTARCLREADDIVVVARADDDPDPGPAELAASAAAIQRGAGRHLVLLHEREVAAGVTDSWLRARSGIQHHHVRADRPAHCARLARLLSGRATGLALSGGGARGFAHIGVLRALDELGVPVDLVAGTSMGAMIAAMHALGHDPGVVLDRCRAWTRERPWSDFTLPLSSIVRGRRIRRAIGGLLGDGRIEDLWLPFACVTANLSQATADVHTSGPLSLLVLASNSVPGLAPPVFYQGDVHVDGGVVDNLPVQALRRMGAGRIVAVDVGTEMRVTVPPNPGENPSGWSILWDGMWRRPKRALPVAATIGRAFTLASDERAHAACRDADLTLRPPLDDYTSTDFKLIDPIAEVGFRHASQQLAAWIAR
jgi:NTE family protein